MIERSIVAADDQTPWGRAMAHYLGCRAAEDAYDSGPYRAAIDRADAQGPMAVFDDRLTDISDRISDETYAAKWALQESPAPDLPALLWKLEHLLDTSGDGSLTPYSAESVAPALADAKRLLGGGGQ